MTDPRGRRSSRDALPPFGVPTAEIPAPGIPGYGVPRYEPARYDPPSWGAERSVPRRPPVPTARPVASAGSAPGCSTGRTTQTGPIVEPEWWAYGSSDDPHYPAARHGGPDGPASLRPSRPVRRRVRRPGCDDQHDDASAAPVRTAPAPAPGRVGPAAPPRGRRRRRAPQTVAHPTAGRSRPTARPDREPARQPPRPMTHRCA